MGGASGEGGGEQAERLAVVGGQRGAVSFEVSRDAAAGGARAVAEGFDAAFPLQLCRKHKQQAVRKRLLPLTCSVPPSALRSRL